MRRRMIIAFLMLLAFGAARMRFEANLEAERKALYFHGAKFNLSLEERIGQMAFVAALSGFRGPIADGLWIYAHVLWEDVQWGRMKVAMDGATELQPRCVVFWENAGWHMAYNASVAAMDDKTQPRLALRVKAQHEYWRMGEDYFLRGIQNNPDSAILYTRLGSFYKEKLEDHAKAAWAYGEGAKLPNAPVFLHRFAAYQIAKIPGREREAYDLLKQYYLNGEEEQLPTLLTELGRLQEKLKIPPEQKIAIPSAPHP